MEKTKAKNQYWINMLILLGALLVALFIIYSNRTEIEGHLFNLNNSITIAIVSLIIFFLLIREIVTWYWKINHIVNLLEKIEENTSSQKNTKERSNP